MTTTTAPPRPPGSDPRSPWEGLREEALIEEARQRARRRRQRGAAVAVLVAGVAIAIGFVRPAGRSHPRVGDARAGPAGVASAAGKSRIAFSTTRALESVNSDGSGLRTLVQCPAKDRFCAVFEPAWSPNGREIAYVLGDRVWPGLHLRLALYVEDASGGGARRLAVCVTCGERDSSRLSWSPDGTRIAYGRPSGDRGQESLWVVDAASGRTRRITSCPHPCTDFDPAWSPDGRVIAFVRFAGRVSALYTVRPDGSGLSRISPHEYVANPQWSPDGQRIAFDSADDILVVNADGSHQRRLLRGEPSAGPGAPSWSPDGSKLAFFRTPGTPGAFTAEVWTMNANGSGRRRLYHSRCCVGEYTTAIWSPDGRKIAFAADSANGTVVIGVDGRNLHRLSAQSAVGLNWQRP
jgi:Tol biopolymer transport system component